jgi:methanogenic corrinoid protein MtbC1
MSANLLQQIVTTISELKDSGKIEQLVREAVSQHIPVTQIVEGGLRKGLDEVGKKYERSEYFLSELLFGASLVNEAFEILEPHLKRAEVESKGTIVLGTVRGDIHDIGKNIFGMFAKAAGFDVYDLGVDVEPARFVEKLKETKAEILALSALLTTTRQEMKNIIDQLNHAGIRVKVLVGGNAITKDFAKEIGADYAAVDAVDGVEMCKKWMSER